METEFKPGSIVVRRGEHIYGVVTSVDDGKHKVHWYQGEQGDTLLRFGELDAAPADDKLRAGDKWLSWTVDEVDHDSRLMKVRVFDDAPAPWIDTALFGLGTPFVRLATRTRLDWLEAGRKKLDWFKPGQIVTGDGALARPATVIEQVSESEVKVITSNGIATVQAVQLRLHALSVQDLKAKEAEKSEAALSRFKDEVLEKAMEAAEEHGWCEEVKEVLKELDIRIPVRKVRAVLHLTVEVDAVIAEGAGMTRLDLERSNNRDWWGQTLKFDDDGKDLQFQSDDDIDMDSVEVRLINARVEEIHDESYLED